MFFREITLAQAASLGDLKAPQTPDEPIVLIMEHVPCEPSKPMKEQHVLGRMKLLQTSYETFESNWDACWGRVVSIRRRTLWRSQ
jgi:spermidine dehydrogenase